MKRRSLRWSAVLVCLVMTFALGQFATTHAATGTNRFRSSWGSTFCLDVPDFGRPPQNHDRLQIYQCHTSGSNQNFFLNDDGTFELLWSPDPWVDLCLDVPNFGRPPQNNDPVQIYQCHGGINQQFFLAGDNSIRLVWNPNLCFDVPNFGRPPQNNDLMQIYQCHGGSNQRWEVFGSPG